MRLIDADKIDFNEVFKGASDFARDTREAAQTLIDAQPTAYNVDKVVEQLEECRKKYQRLCKEQGESEDEAMNIHFRGAINIVKAGGVE